MSEKAKAGDLKVVDDSAGRPEKKRRRWDVETPVLGAGNATPLGPGDATPGGGTPSSAPKKKLGWDVQAAAEVTWADMR